MIDTPHFTQYIERMLTQDDIQVIEEIVEEKLGAQTSLLPTKEEFFSKMDEVMGELKAIREEHSLLGHTVSEHADHMEELDTRVTKLEKRTPPTPLS